MKINKTRFKLRFEKFLKEELWQHILVIAFVFICAWLFDKYVEAFMFCVAHIVIRKYFDKQYHSGSIAVCMFITLSVIFFGTANMDIYLKLAKDFFEDPDTALRYGEKLATYYYDIVEGM